VVLDALERLLAWPLVLLVRFYRLFISPALAPACKYHPSCSAYADEALRTHGLVRGGALVAWRLCRCNPLSRGGVDFVPRSPLERGAGDTPPMFRLKAHDLERPLPPSPQETSRCRV
jgi:putative membrane protein insertion efficiency factor